MRGSSAWLRSHHTVAFCFRRRATYEVAAPVERPEEERRMEVLCLGAEELVDEVEVVAFERVRRVDWPAL
jgi:transcriptional/translational regulatory protein YebC/TACO1